MRRLVLVTIVGACMFAILPAAAIFRAQTTTQGGFSTAVLNPPTDVATGCDLVAMPHVKLTWSPVVGETADGYEILRSEATGGPYVQVAFANGASSREYTDTDVELMVTYYYVVRTGAGSWTSVNSNEASGEATTDCMPEP